MNTPQDTPLPGRLRPLGSLLAHRRAALAASLAVGLLGAPVAWIKGTPSYSAQALIHVAPRYMKNARDDQELDFQSNTQYRQFVQQQVQTIRRRDVMIDAVRRIDAAGVHWRTEGESFERAADRLAAVAQVGAVPDTYLVRIAMGGPEREGLAQVANAIADAYLERSRRESLYGSEQRQGNLRERLAGVESELAGLSARRAQIARELGVSTFVNTQLNPFDNLYVEAREALSVATRKRIEAEARLAAFRERGAPDPGLQAPADVVALDAGLNSLKANLYKRRAELVSGLSGLGDSHPAATAGRDEIADIDSEVTAQTRRLDATARAGVRAKLEAAVALTRRTEAELRDQMEIERRRSSEHASRYSEALALGVQIERLAREQDELLSRAAFFDTESNAPGFVYLALPASLPEFPVSGGRRKPLLAAMLAAIAAGIALPTVIDLLSRRVRGPLDARAALAFPPAGWLADDRVAGAAAFNSAQQRRIAARLLRECDRHGTRVFALAGVRADASRAAAIALAQELAALGSRTLVIHARTGDEAQYAGARPGLAQALSGEADVAECVMPASRELPARIRSGLADGPIPALRRLPELLATLPADYDLVLLDAPALLGSPDAELVLAAAGGALLLVDSRADTRSDVREAAALLERIAPASAGAVLLHVDPSRAGGYAGELAAEISGDRTSGGRSLLAGWRRVLAPAAAASA